MTALRQGQNYQVALIAPRSPPIPTQFRYLYQTSCTLEQLQDAQVVLCFIFVNKKKKFHFIHYLASTDTTRLYLTAWTLQWDYGVEELNLSKLWKLTGKSGYYQNSINNPPDSSIWNLLLLG
jgi:hypothetical protein